MIIQLGAQYLPGLLLLKPTVYYDHRGYFLESYHQKKILDIDLNITFVQDNQSCSKKGTVRGMHYQLAPYAQSKLIHVVHGTIWDVVVDLRKGMDTFGKWQGFLLDSTNHYQLFVPKGFAHGFIALSNEAIISYKCDTFHCSNAERGIYFQDPILNIPWENYETPRIISKKDLNLPLFSDVSATL